MENYEPRAEDYDFICPILNEVFRDPVKAEDRKNTSFIMAYLTNSWGRLAYTRPWLIKASREFHVPLDQWIGHLPSLQKTLYTRCMILSCVLLVCLYCMYISIYVFMYMYLCMHMIAPFLHEMFWCQYICVSIHDVWYLSTCGLYASVYSIMYICIYACMCTYDA